MKTIKTFQQWIERDPDFSGRDDLALVRETKRKVKWIDFCRPHHGYHFHEGGHGFQIAFYAFQWMVRTASGDYGHSKPQYHRGTVDSLGGQSSIGSSEVAPFRADWKETLFYRLWNGVLGGNYLEAWRKATGIEVASSRVIPLNAYRFKCGNRVSKTFEDAFDQLFIFAGGRLKYSPNDCHKRARWVSDVFLTVRPKCFQVTLDYGYVGDGGWKLRWQSNDGEALIDFVCRIGAILRRIVTPKK